MKPGDISIQNGLRFFQRGNYVKAEEFFNEALNQECSLGKPKIYIYIANCYSKQGDYSTAIDYRIKSLELLENTESYNNLGLLYRLNKDDTNAEQMYLKAIDLDPKDATAYISLGALYMTSKQFTQALTYLEKGNELDSSIAIVHADLAICYAQLNNFERAEEEYEYAVTLKVDNHLQFREQLDILEGKTK